MAQLFKNYSLSIVLILLFLVSWIGQGIFQWVEFVQEQKEHGQSVHIEEFVAPFLSATFENWQSEFLQLFTFVILSTYLIHKNSPQSRDGDDEMQKMLTEIQKKVANLDRKKK